MFLSNSLLQNNRELTPHSGYSLAPLWYAVPTMTVPCIRSFGPGDSITVVGTVTEPITSGVLMHEAWHVSWRGADTSTLSPSLPALTLGESFKTWVPGQSQTQTPSPGRGGEQPDHSWDGVLRFLMIGLPIIVVGLVAAIAFYCLYARRRARMGKRDAIPETVRKSARMG